MSNEPATNARWDESLFNVDLPTTHSGKPGSMGSSGLGASLGDPLTSKNFDSLGTDQSKAASDHAAAMSAVIKQLQLDDWEIKPHEIDIMLDSRGQACLLGEGAFGAVRYPFQIHMLIYAFLSCSNSLPSTGRSAFLNCCQA